MITMPYSTLTVRPAAPSECPFRAGAAGRGGTVTSQHQGQAMSDETPDFTGLDDFTLISLRAQMRAELERLPPLSAGHVRLMRAYDASTAEINERARRAWTRAS
jgi:hypothetical protein